MSYKNSEGYTDQTAGMAMAIVRKEEQDIAKTQQKLIHMFLTMVDLTGFEIVGRVTMRHKKSGKIFR